MVNSALGNKCERPINLHDTSMVQRKNLSPRQESNPLIPEHRAGTPFTELRKLKESKFIWLSPCVTGVLHTAKISTVEVILN